MTSPTSRAALLVGLRSLRRRRISHAVPSRGIPTTKQTLPASLVQGLSPRRNRGACVDNATASMVVSPTMTVGNSGFDIISGRNIHAVRADASVFVTDPEEEEEDTSTHPSSFFTKKKFDSDLVVVLDMDECLIHSQFLSQQIPGTHSHQLGQRRNKPNAQDQYRQYEERPQSQHSIMTSPRSLRPPVDSFRLVLANDDIVHVNKRPKLDDFLQNVTSRFETHVFTAAVEEYARPVLDKLDPHGTMFQRRFYRESCSFDSTMGVFIKDLANVLGQQQQQQQEEEAISSSSPYNERRVVLVDNNPLSFMANPRNGILVSNFYDDPSDDTLLAVYELLHELDSSEDVRPLLDQRFGLRDALKEVVKTGGGWR